MQLNLVYNLAHRVDAGFLSGVYPNLIYQKNGEDMKKRDYKNVTVYGLCSSEDDQVRYIGQTITALNARLSKHLYIAERRDYYVARWIRSVLAKGYEIKIFPIEENAIYNDSEKKWIDLYRKQGARLVNCTDGGEGFIGYQHTAKDRERQAQAMRGRKLSVEHRQKLSIAGKGKPHSEEWNKKVAAAKRGKSRPSFSEEWRRNLGLAGKGKKRPPRSDQWRARSSETRRRNGSHRGERNSSAKLDEAKVLQIYQRYAKGESLASISRQYQVTPECVGAIIRGRTWKHLYCEFHSEGN